MTRPSAGLDGQQLHAASDRQRRTAPSIARQATPPDTPLDSRRPRVALIRKPANGSERDEGSIAIGHHLSDVNTSGLSDSLCRNSAMTSARPTAASAAATVITKNTMIWPSTEPK